MIQMTYLVVKVLVDLGEVIDVGLVDPLLVVQSLSLQVQLGQILKVCTNLHGRSGLRMPISSARARISGSSQL